MKSRRPLPLFVFLIVLLSAAWPLATRAAVAAAALSKASELVQNKKDAEARVLVGDLLNSSPGDARLLALAKQLKSRPITAAELRGRARVMYAAAEERLRSAVADDVNERAYRGHLRTYLDLTLEVISEYPGLTALWVKRARVAVELDAADDGREAGARLLALGAADNGDARALDALGRLELKGWLSPEKDLSADELNRTYRFSKGGETSLRELLKGRKALLILFWAEWCRPCMKALGPLRARQQKLDPLQIAVAAINTWEKDLTQPERVRKDLGIEFAWLLDAPGTETPLTTALGLDTIPRAVLISPEGKILFNGRPASDVLDQTLASLTPTP